MKENISGAYDMFTTIMLEHKTSLYTFESIEVIPYVLSIHRS